MPSKHTAPTRQVMAAAAVANAPINEAEAYGVSLAPANPPDGDLFWQVINIRHLSADENRGKHNIYVRALDEQGMRARNPALRATYTWIGRRAEEEAPPRPLDKGDADIGHADIDVNEGQHIAVWLEGDGLPSDRVVNLHTDHEASEKTSNGQDGNTRFHHSFLVTFQRTRQAALPPGGGEAPPPTPVATGIDDAAYVRDADPVEDGAVLQPGARFTKRWVLRNTGETTWGEGYRLVHTAGERLGAPAAAPVPVTPPGAEATLAVEFVTHASSTELRSDWRLANPAGVQFGPPVWAIVYAPADTGDLAATFPPPAAQRIDAERIIDFSAKAAALFWNRYGGLILDECARLRIDPADAVGVLVTESAGQPFGAEGRMLIRFENHLFWRFWGEANPTIFNQHFAFDPQVTWQGHRWSPDGVTWLSCHVDNAQEWQVFELARRLDEHAAIQSISMGAAQIMGFNHASIGYPTPQTMFAAFEHDAGAQLRALFRFMEVNNLVDAVRAKEYRRFALAYNGSGQPDFYAGKMREYAAAFAALRPAAMSATGVALDEQLASPPATPQPTSPTPGVPLAKADPQLYAAWRTHIENGFKNNEIMFGRVLEAFMNPYWTTVWMYRILFGVGVAAFVVAALIALLQNNVVTTLVFGGLSVAAFLGYFVSRPLQALEENLQFITWLGIIYNSYWTTLVQSQDPDAYIDEVKQATDDTIGRIKDLMYKHTERSGARPNVKE
ncbi:MAG TPA: N-acetylmuramidase domain-containing protein [Caldilinea sp.]|nr:N-acetylmuramidase domain-containing protein [Caldilinea sp.]